MVNYNLLNSRVFESLFSISDPLTVLENQELVLKWYEKLNNQLHGNEEYNSEYKIKIDCIENYILYLTSKKNRVKREDDILSLYQNIYTDLFNNSDLDCMVSSKIYRYFNVALDDEHQLICGQRLVDLTRKALDIFDRFTSKEEIDQSEINFLFEYLTNNINTENPKIIKMQEAFATWLLNTNIDYGIYSKNFLLYFFMHKFCIENVYSDVPIYISNVELITGDDLKGNGRTSFSPVIITLNYDFVNGNFNDILSAWGIYRSSKVLHTLFHELQHVRQHNEFKNDIVINNTVFNLIKTRLLEKYLSKDGQREYLVNYKYREIERESDIFGWVQLFKTLNEYAPSKIHDIDKTKLHAVTTSYEQSVSFQTDLESHLSNEIAFYNVVKLIDIIKEHPEVIKKYPHLRLFYHESGNRKSLKDLIIIYSDIADNNNRFENYEVDINIFDEFFKVIIEENGINSFPLNLPEKYQITWFSIIFKLFREENKNISQMKYIAQKLNLSVLNHFCKSRTKYSTTYHDYLIKNYNAILHLKNYTEFHKELFDYIDKETIEKEYAQAMNNIKDAQTYVKGNEYGIR